MKSPEAALDHMAYLVEKWKDDLELLQYDVKDSHTVFGSPLSQAAGGICFLIKNYLFLFLNTHFLEYHLNRIF